MINVAWFYFCVPSVVVLYGAFFFYCVLTKFAEFDYVSSDLKLMMTLGVSGSYPEA